MYPDSHLVFKHGETQDERCKADQISEKVAILVGTLGLSENVPGMGLVLFYGWLSDTYGRRIVLLSLLVGGVLQDLITLYTAAHFASIGVSYFYLASFVAGLSGTSPALRTATWSMIVDIVPESQRLQAFSTIQAINYIGMIIGPACGSFLLSYHLLWPLWTSTLLLISAVILLWFMSESLRIQNSHSIPAPANNLSRKDLITKFLIVTKAALSSLRILTSSRTAMILGFIAFLWNFTGGVMLIVVQFLNHDFNWSFTNGGYFYSLFAMLKVFVLLVILPLFTSVARQRQWTNVNEKLLTAGLVGDGLAYTSYFLMTTTSVLPFIIILQAICAPLAVSLRVLISELGDTRKSNAVVVGSGKVFAAVSVLEGFGDLAGPAVWNGTYAALLSKDRGGVVFLLVGLVYITGAGVSWFYRSLGDDDTDATDGCDQESLLVDERSDRSAHRWTVAQANPAPN